MSFSVWIPTSDDLYASFEPLEKPSFKAWEGNTLKKDREIKKILCFWKQNFPERACCKLFSLCHKHSATPTCSILTSHTVPHGNRNSTHHTFKRFPGTNQDWTKRVDEIIKASIRFMFQKTISISTTEYSACAHFFPSARLFHYISMLLHHIGNTLNCRDFVPQQCIHQLWCKAFAFAYIYIHYSLRQLQWRSRTKAEPKTIMLAPNHWQRVESAPHQRA